jgi:hypothetical protein
LNEEVLATPAPDLESLEQADYRAYRETGKVPEKQAEQAAVETTSADSDEESTTAADSETATEDQEQPKKKGGFQKRIDKLTREKAELEARLAAATAGTKAEEKPAEQKPAAEGKPQAKDFVTYEDYVEKLTEWKLEQREIAKTAKAQADAQAAEQRKAAESWNTQLADARTRYADYDQVAFQDVPISDAAVKAIMHSENGADVAYHLGQNPEERERINTLNPIAAAVAIGKIAATLAKTSSTPETKKPKVSAAPPPIKPVNSKTANTQKSVDEMTSAEYRAAREAGKIR